MYHLTVALLAATTALAAPAGISDQNSCTSKSTKVTGLLVKDFGFHASYTFSTPAHQIAGGLVNFTLANPVLDYELRCSASSGQLTDFFYGTMNYNCTDDQTGKQTQQGTFSYSRPTNEIAVNQTWRCPEQSIFWAEGTAKLNLSCHETNYQNPNWTMGQIYSNRVITCDKHTQPVPLTSLRAAA